LPIKPKDLLVNFLGRLIATHLELLVDSIIKHWNHIDMDIALPAVSFVNNIGTEAGFTYEY